MSMSTREQVIAYLALIIAILTLGLAPVIVAGILGHNLPDSLIAVSDKTVTGLVGVLGTISAMIFRSNKMDELRAANTGAAFQAITATAAGVPTPPPPTQKVEVTNATDNPVPTTSEDTGSAAEGKDGQ